VDARGEPRSPSWFALEALEGMGMEKLGAKDVAKLCDQVADLIEADPGYAVRVARRLAMAMRPAAAAAAK